MTTSHCKSNNWMWGFIFCLMILFMKCTRLENICWIKTAGKCFLVCRKQTFGYHLSSETYIIFVGSCSIKILYLDIGHNSEKTATRFCTIFIFSCLCSAPISKYTTITKQKFNIGDARAALLNVVFLTNGNRDKNVD